MYKIVLSFFPISIFAHSQLVLTLFLELQNTAYSDSEKILKLGEHLVKLQGQRIVDAIDLR